MGICSRCGGPAPGNIQGEICPICRQKMKAAEYEKQKKINEKYGNSSQNTTGYRPSANSWQTNASIHKSGSGIRTLIILAIVFICAFLGIRYLTFNSTESKLEDSFEITTPLSGDGSDFVNEILTRDNSSAVYGMKITEYPTDYWKTIFDLSKKSAYIKGYVQNGEMIWKYNFEDDDAGTGLKHMYYLAKVNGTLCIADYDKEVLYPEGSEFFNKYYNELLVFQYDNIMPKLTEGLAGGKYGSETHDKKVVLKGDKVSVSVYDDGYHKTRILDERSAVRVQYEFNYFESNNETLPDFSEYKIAE